MLFKNIQFFLILMKELLSLLKRFFGYTSFRPLQAEIIQRTLQKEDSLVLMPTGGGKSICFQLPAIYMPGTAIVVSPLIALMKDQVEGLIANGIPAATLNSMMPEEERHRVRQLCIQGKVKLLYISPEGIISELHWLLPRIDISLIAIDEAHCISHWGHDFRPEYTQLSVLKENFPKVPIIALTATADKITRTDILNQLKLRDPKTFISSFDRPNLSLTIRRGLSKKEKIVFPIFVTIFCSLILPDVAPLLGMLMLGNLFKESGVVDRLSDTAQNALCNIVTIMIGLSVGATANGEAFIQVQTLAIVVLGLVAFSFSTVGGVLLGKLLCVITHGKINPLIGSAGVSAVPMAARVSQKVGSESDPHNFLLMHAMGPNVAGVIGSAVAAGFFMLTFGG